MYFMVNITIVIL